LAGLNGTFPWPYCFLRFETSAKDNINIEEAVQFLVTKILETETHPKEPAKEAAAPKLDIAKTDNPPEAGKPSSGCKC